MISKGVVKVTQPLSTLIGLTHDHKDELETFLAEFDHNPNELHGYFCARDSSIEQAVYLLDAWSRGEALNDGWVPCSTWFWSDGNALQGVINVRHRLTPALETSGGHIGYCVAPSHRRKGVATAMLKAVLPHCRDVGIQRALLTCDRDNWGSARTIEANGGVLNREAWSPSDQRVTRWYHIQLAMRDT